MGEQDWDDESGHTHPLNLSFTKNGDSENMQNLHAPITGISRYHHIDSLQYPHCSALNSGVFYINAYGQEVHPRANPAYVNALRERDALVYSCGSLWTR